MNARYRGKSQERQTGKRAKATYSERLSGGTDKYRESMEERERVELT